MNRQGGDDSHDELDVYSETSSQSDDDRTAFSISTSNIGKKSNIVKLLEDKLNEYYPGNKEDNHRFLSKLRLPTISRELEHEDDRRSQEFINRLEKKHNEDPSPSRGEIKNFIKTELRTLREAYEQEKKARLAAEQRASAAEAREQELIRLLATKSQKTESVSDSNATQSEPMVNQTLGASSSTSSSAETGNEKGQRKLFDFWPRKPKSKTDETSSSSSNSSSSSSDKISGPALSARLQSLESVYAGFQVNIVNQQHETQLTPIAEEQARQRALNDNADYSHSMNVEAQQKGSKIPKPGEKRDRTDDDDNNDNNENEDGNKKKKHGPG